MDNVQIGFEIENRVFSVIIVSQSKNGMKSVTKQALSIFVNVWIRHLCMKKKYILKTITGIIRHVMDQNGQHLATAYKAGNSW